MTLSFKSLLETNSTIDTVGEMLNDYWHLKKSLQRKLLIIKLMKFTILNNSGASGGKVIGSGGMVLF